jgi:hypothetical protein
MNKAYCDKCGKETNYRDFRNVAFRVSGSHHIYDICETCYAKIFLIFRKWMKPNMDNVKNQEEFKQ